MEHEVTNDPGFSMLKVDVDSGDRLLSEPGAMVAMSRDIELDAKLSGEQDAGFFTTIVTLLYGLIRKVSGNESFFVNHYETGGKGGRVWLSPTMSGDVHHRKLDGESLKLSSGAYLASSGDVDVEMKFGGLKGFLIPWKSTFKLVASGQGDLWFNSYGGIRAIEVDGSYTVDDGHIVAYEGALDKKTRTPGGGVTGLLASGEGTVKEFQGKGTVYLQTRNQTALVEWLTPMLPH